SVLLTGWDFVSVLEVWMDFAFAILLVLFLALFGCEEKTTNTEDSSPWTQQLINHLGNTGDFETVTFEFNTPDGLTTETVILNDLTNGIDAVPGDDWIKIQWVPFVNEEDLEFMRVYRLRKTANNSAPVVLVDSLRTGIFEHYEDKTLAQQGFSPINNEWIYYIEIVNRAGRSSFSDSVSYKLLEKPIPISPNPGVTVLAGEPLTFSWNILPGGGISRYRVLLFDSFFNLKWFFNEVDTDPESDILEVLYDGDTLESGDYYWRVDAFGEEVNINSGSESEERPLFVQ
ncbi:MAG: hypothetical protein K8S56_08190, partial [Candidatus Cloacimonetes bacterium]|nr:hypothetical protein [Candidatus Cloacimonadota bacterium]